MKEIGLKLKCIKDNTLKIISVQRNILTETSD